jgi:hypothetical protein
VKHIPMTPTPGPPARACRCRASARTYSAIGRSARRAKAANSAVMHALARVATAYPRVGRRPGVPNSEGTATVNPAATRWFARPITCGVRPGISGRSTTPGPMPRV